MLVEPKRFEVRELPLLDPEPGRARIRLQGCGVCASNIPPWEGRPWFSYPLPPGNPGHEAWGVVDAVGAGVTTLQVGQRVAVLSENAYATYDFVEPSKAVALPASLATRPFPGEPLACAYNVYRRAEILPGQDVAIIGIGFMGALLTALCASAGARVIAISRRASSLAIAEQMGAQVRIVMDDHHRIIDEVSRLTNGQFCPRVIECAGAQWPLDLAAQLTGVRGRLLVAGYHQDGPRQVDMQLWNWRGLDVVNAHERDPAVYVRGLRDAVAAVESGKLDPFPLLTHTYPIDRIDEAFRATSERPEGFMKAILRYD